MSQTSGSAYGQHLLLDGYGGDPKSLGSETHFRQTVAQLVRTLNLEQITPITAISLSSEDLVALTGSSVEEAERDVGITGGVYIVQSHVHIHTYSQRGALFADVFVCGRFDSALAIKTLVKAFSLDRVETRVETRGAHFFGA